MPLNSNEKRSLINMGGLGITGPYPIPDGDLNNVPDLRHLLGLYRLEVSGVQVVPSGISDDGDILMEYDPQGEGTSIILDRTDLVRDKGFKTAVLISMLTDKVADLTDVLPDNTGIRRGFWGDLEIGSKLWLLYRSKLTPDMPSRIEAETKECLQWMIDEGAASDVLVSAERTAIDTIDWGVSIVKPGAEENENFKFFFNWESQIFGEL